MNKRILTILIIASLLTVGNGAVKAEKGTYVKGYLSETANLRDKPSGKLIGRLYRNSYVEGYKIGDWIKLSTGRYVYDFGLIKANTISGYISRPTYIRDYKTNEIVGVYQLLEKVSGIKDGNWIQFEKDGKLLKVYDFGLLKGEHVSGYLSESTNIREYSTGKLVDRYPTFTKVSGIKDGNWIHFEKDGKILKVYDFGLLKGEKVEGYLIYSTNVRTKPNGKLITKYSAGSFVSGIKDGNWIRFIHEGEFASIYDFGLTEKPSTPSKPKETEKEVEKPSTPKETQKETEKEAEKEKEQIRQEFLEELNKYRRSKGLVPVQYHPQFQAIADLRAKELVEHNYFEHIRPDMKTSIFDTKAYNGLIDGNKYFINTENLSRLGARATADHTFSLWKASPGHNANLLNPQARLFGLGIAVHPGKGVVFVYISGYDRSKIVNPFDKLK